MKVMRLQVGILLFIIALAITLSAWRVARAYIIQYKWQTSNATYRYHSSLPANFQSPTASGANAWTNVTTSSWTWSVSSSGENYVKYEAIDGKWGAAATTVRWISGGYIIKMNVIYDNAENWYTGRDAPGSSQVDARSVATHEFGHGLGLGHTQSENCPGGSSNATMCSGLPLGTTWMRTLESDDKSGVSAAYP